VVELPKLKILILGIGDLIMGDELEFSQATGTLDQDRSS